MNKPNVEFVVSRNLNDLKAYAKIIQENKLHFKYKGTIEHLMIYVLSLVRRQKNFVWYKNKIRYSRPSWVISLCFINEVPVGCLVINGFSIDFYVKPEFRKKGIASLLFRITNLYYDLSMKVLNYGESKAVNRLKNKFDIKSSIEEF